MSSTIFRGVGSRSRWRIDPSGKDAVRRNTLSGVAVAHNVHHWKLRTMLVGIVVLVGAAMAIYFALTPAIGAGLFGIGGGVILSPLAMAIDRSWQRQGIPKKRPELA
jgi:hypothetical protein